jgi:hypothetical protein
MAKRGRPRTDGAKPGWVFHRMIIVLFRYNEARTAGEKHSVAIREAVSAVRRDLPEIPISEAEVRRVLSQLQPKCFRCAYVVSKSLDAPFPLPQLPPAMCRKWGLPVTPKMARCFEFGIGHRHDYPRTNARPAKPTARRKK